MLIRRSSKNIWRSIAKWTCINLRMVASPLSCSATWQVYDEDKNCLSCPDWISGEELKQPSIAWTKIADRRVKYSCQISEEIGRPCRWRKSDVHQLALTPEDRKPRRCLWRDLDQSKEPDVWEFLRYVFGGGGGGVVTDHSVHSMHGRSMQMTTKQGTLSQLKRKGRVVTWTTSCLQWRWNSKGGAKAVNRTWK